MEFTGDYYKCNNCHHIWDYDDFNCPDCGSEDFDDINANEVNDELKEMMQFAEHLKKILKSHNDLKL